MKQKLGVMKTPGRSRIEYSQPDLLGTIVSLVTLDSGTHARRRQERQYNTIVGKMQPI